MKSGRLPPGNHISAFRVCSPSGELPIPRYYFHARSHEKFQADLEGTELASDQEARAEAIAAAREIIAEHILAGDSVDGHVFEINDKNGRVVERIPFRSIIVD
ncbi:MAG: DUF6894 family protein [Devosia sp.]